ncbi:MAG TPA: hypothetical protein VGJ96_11535 [Gemmatimonadaceae bacterium]|jgi:hypothetical protein
MTIQRLMSPDAISAEFGPISELPALRTGVIDPGVIRAHRKSRTLWTLVDGPFGPLLTSGYHLVNRLAYCSSAKPVPHDVIVDEAPDTALEVCDTCDAAWDSDLYEQCPYCEGDSR